MSADTTIEQRFQLRSIDQISFAVADVDEAVPRYTAMFGGPFNVIEVPRMEVVYGGHPSTTALKIGFGRTADIEVELVQVVAGEWPTLDWLATHGEGLHHLRFPVSDVDATSAQMQAAGLSVTVAGGAAGIAFAYLESPLPNGMTVEIIHMPPS